LIRNRDTRGVQACTDGGGSARVTGRARGQRPGGGVDAQLGRRLKTVELIVDSKPWHPLARRPRRRDDAIVAVRIAFHETELRERARRLGGVWRPAQKLWEITWRDVRRLGIADRVADA